ILRGVRQQQDEPGRFSICSRQAAVVLWGFRIKAPLCHLVILLSCYLVILLSCHPNILLIC
ncbi:hypothetical protein BL132_00009505, partial [Klebsiella pneumoniae]